MTLTWWGSEVRVLSRLPRRSAGVAGTVPSASLTARVPRAAPPPDISLIRFALAPQRRAVLLTDAPVGAAQNGPMTQAQRNPESRTGEPPSKHFRSERCIQVNGDWYVATREGIEVGPYKTRERAEAAAAQLAKQLAGIADPNLAALCIRGFSPPAWRGR